MLVVKNLPANAVDTGSIPGLGRSPGVGNGNPLLYSCLENSMDREARKAMAHGVAKESQLSSWAQQADIRVLGKAAVLIGAWGLPSSVELMAAVTPSRCMSAISGYLLAVSQGLSSVPGGPSRFLAVWPPRSVHRVDLFVFFPTNQGVSLRLPRDSRSPSRQLQQGSPSTP